MSNGRRRYGRTLISPARPQLARDVRKKLLATFLAAPLGLPVTAACSREPEPAQARAAIQGSAQVRQEAQGQTKAQGPWRGLDVPRYANGIEFEIEADEDEYEICFRSRDKVRAIFDFYRDYLQQQGFRVARSQIKEHGFKVDMVRGQGSPNDTIELDAKRRDGRYEVEIEFDE